VVELTAAGVEAFLETCGQLRLWDRERETVSVG
jgi:hypothetical protein